MWLFGNLLATGLLGDCAFFFGRKNVLVGLRGVAGVCTHNSDHVRLGMVPKRFIASRSRVARCLSLAAVGSEATRTRGVTRRLTTGCRMSAPISAVVYVSKLRMVNTCLSRRLAGTNVFSLGTRRAVCIVAPRSDGSKRVVFHSGFRPVVGNGGMLVLGNSVAANSALSGTVRDVLCCKNAVENVTTVFDEMSDITSLPMCSVFGAGSVPSCRSCSSAGYPVYRERRGVSTVIDDCKCSTLWVFRMFCGRVIAEVSSFI